MNDNTKIIYNLSRMYEYITDALTICEQNDFNYEKIIENMVTKHAVNMYHYVRLTVILGDRFQIVGSFPIRSLTRRFGRRIWAAASKQ